MDRRTRARITAVLLAVVLVLALAGGLIQGTGTTDGDDGSTTTSIGPTPRHSDLPTIAVTDLPHEALETIALISRNGPFPYEQDGSIFGNREGLLPSGPPDFYREYTVPAPGSPDRGARRIVVGADGGVYYTDDHYSSFREVVGDG